MPGRELPDFAARRRELIASRPLWQHPSYTRLRSTHQGVPDEVTFTTPHNVVFVPVAKEGSAFEHPRTKQVADSDGVQRVVPDYPSVQELLHEEFGKPDSNPGYEWGTGGHFESTPKFERVTERMSRNMEFMYRPAPASEPELQRARDAMKARGEFKYPNGLRDFRGWTLPQIRQAEEPFV